MYPLGNMWRQDPGVMSRWAEVAAAVHERTR
jgi:hypothetical protein